MSNKREIVHSEEFRDVISKFPKKFNAILSISLTAIVIIGLLLGWFIQSPEVIVADVRVTAEKPPISLVSEASGKLHIVGFSPQKHVKKNVHLAIIENPANELHVSELKDSLDKYKTSLLSLKLASFDFAMNYNLGEIQSAYFEFVNTLFMLENNRNKNEFDAQKKLLNQQIGKYYEMIDQREELKGIKLNEVSILKQKVYEDSILFSKGIIVKPEYEQSQRELLRESENYKNYESQDIVNKLNITESRERSNLLSLQKELTLSELQVKLLNAFQQLILNINKWERSYLIKAPFDGQVDYLSFVTSDQFVKQGEALFSILPNDNKIIAHVLMPSEGAGKVRIGQMVNIKLNAFPYQEFGKLVGKVKSISLIPNESAYLVIVELPDGLKSDTDKTLSFGKDMIGTAEIITNKRRLIFKVFDKIRHALERKKEKPVEEKEKTETVKKQ